MCQNIGSLGLRLWCRVYKKRLKCSFQNIYEHDVWVALKMYCSNFIGAANAYKAIP